MCFLEIHALTKLTEVSLFSRSVNFILKVLTNEKRGGVTVVSFDRFPFNYSLWNFRIGASPILWEAQNYSASPVSVICKQ